MKSVSEPVLNPHQYSFPVCLIKGDYFHFSTYTNAVFTDASTDDVAGFCIDSCVYVSALSPMMTIKKRQQIGTAWDLRMEH